MPNFTRGGTPNEWVEHEAVAPGAVLDGVCHEGDRLHGRVHRELITPARLETVHSRIVKRCRPPAPSLCSSLATWGSEFFVGSYRLIVLSNGDPDMLETAKHHHGIAFDDVISVAVANAFKPHVATYTKAAELAGDRRGLGRREAARAREPRLKPNGWYCLKH